MKALIGDKVRLKSKLHGSYRGRIEDADGHEIVVQLEDTYERVKLRDTEVINLSLAGRRAWVSMPKRKVGRKPGVRLRDRISVTLRIDRELWDRFQQLETRGLIDDRPSTVNSWFREKVVRLEKNGSPEK